MSESRTKKTSPYPLRLDVSLKKWAEERAKKNGRSMNSEIIQILKETREVEDQKQTA